MRQEENQGEQGSGGPGEVGLLLPPPPTPAWSGTSRELTPAGVPGPRAWGRGRGCRCGCGVRVSVG